MQIAIDGPAGSGKSTVAKIVAKELGFVYVDTGAMYRALTLLFLKSNLEINEENGLILLKENNISFSSNCITINNIECEDKIRMPEIATNVSLVASFIGIRNELKIIQQNIAFKNSAVMDGRDIGSNVLKNAEIKIFLDADISVRAKRRFQEFLEKDPKITIDEVIKSIKVRDELDNKTQIRLYGSTIANDAIKIDTTKLTLDQVVQKILDIVKRKEMSI